MRPWTKELLLKQMIDDDVISLELFKVQNILLIFLNLEMTELKSMFTDSVYWSYN